MKTRYGLFNPLLLAVIILCFGGLCFVGHGCSTDTFMRHGYNLDRQATQAADELFSGRRPQNLLLITIDTLRADHLGCYGNKNLQTPNIDALAQQGVLFRQAFSPVPLTLPSHASIMTGLYPPVHGLRDNGYFILGDEVKTLAETLNEHGYTTGAIIASFVLHSRFGLAQGFDFYEDSITPDPDHRDPLQYERTADKVLELATDWLVKNKDRRFFLWLHFFDPHDPYNPPEPYKSSYAKKPYDGEIAFTDYCLGNILKTMDECKTDEYKLRENTLIVLTSDHGEGLGEHEEKTHGVFIYDSTLHVPLIISAPGFRAAGQSPDFLVRTIDILPTTLGLLGLAKPGEKYGQGLNLVPWLQGKGEYPPEILLYAESLYTRLNFDWSALKGIRSREWKYIQAPVPELYHISLDPGEKLNLLLAEQGPLPAEQHLMPAEQSLAIVWESRLKEMEEGFAAWQAKKTAGSQIVADHEIRERLMSLGYLCSPRKTSALRSNRPPIDPKDMIQVLKSIDEGQTLYAAGKLELAVSQFEKILYIDPGNIFIHYLLGDIHSRMGDFNKALDSYQIVQKDQEDYLEVQNHIGSVYDHLGKYELAVEHFQKAAAQYPDQPRAYNNLGIIYIKTNQLAEAEKALLKALDRSQGNAQERAISYRCLGDTHLRMNDEKKAWHYYQQALSLQPNMVEVDLELARHYTAQRRYSLAIPHWERVISLLPQDAQSFFTLGQCYLLSGDQEKARQLFQQCLQIQPDLIHVRRLLESLPE